MGGRAWPLSWRGSGKPAGQANTREDVSSCRRQQRFLGHQAGGSIGGPVSGSLGPADGFAHQFAGVAQPQFVLDAPVVRLNRLRAEMQDRGNAARSPPSAGHGEHFQLAVTERFDGWHDVGRDSEAGQIVDLAEAVLEVRFALVRRSPETGVDDVKPAELNPLG